MALEDEAIADLQKALVKVWQLPRPSLRTKILLEALYWIAGKLNIKIEEEK